MFKSIRSGVERISKKFDPRINTGQILLSIEEVLLDVLGKPSPEVVIEMNNVSKSIVLAAKHKLISQELKFRLPEIKKKLVNIQDYKIVIK